MQSCSRAVKVCSRAVVQFSEDYLELSFLRKIVKQAVIRKPIFIIMRIVFYIPILTNYFQWFDPVTA